MMIQVGRRKGHYPFSLPICLMVTYMVGRRLTMAL